MSEKVKEIKKYKLPVITIVNINFIQPEGNSMVEGDLYAFFPATSPILGSK